jgi:hypothetical protein
MHVSRQQIERAAAAGRPVDSNEWGGSDVAVGDAEESLLHPGGRQVFEPQNEPARIEVFTRMRTFLVAFADLVGFALVLVFLVFMVVPRSKA